MPSKGSKRIQRLRRRLKKEGLDAIVIIDRRNTQYLSGFTGSFSYIIADQDGASFLTDPRYGEVAEKTLGHEFDVITLPALQLTQKLHGILIEKKYKAIGFEGVISYNQYDALSQWIGKNNMHRADPLILDMRIKKDEEELAAIKKAVRLADKLMKNAIGMLAPGIRECDVSREIRYMAEKFGAEGESFSNIVASGPNSSRPHHHPGKRRMRNGDAVTIDLGAIVDGYCSDLTRTVVIGEPKKGFREIYDVCLEANEAAIKAIRPGMTGAQVDAVARDIIKEAGYGEYFGHGLGHGVGVEIHEDPRLSPASKTAKIPAGAIVTIEPGIYIPGRYGVRIEDYVHVTKEGAEVLSKAPKRFKKI